MQAASDLGDDLHEGGHVVAEADDRIVFLLAAMAPATVVASAVSSVASPAKNNVSSIGSASAARAPIPPTAT